jgi:hypothetical protein
MPVNAGDCVDIDVDRGVFLLFLPERQNELKFSQPLLEDRAENTVHISEGGAQQRHFTLRF